MNIIKRIYQAIRYRRFFVILDPSDNSCVVSESLYKHMQRQCNDELDTVLTALLPYNGSLQSEYFFAANPAANGWHVEELDQCISRVQFNLKHKCVGWVMDCPTVQYMFMEYNLPAVHPFKMLVIPDHLHIKEIGQKLKLYRICR